MDQAVQQSTAGLHRPAALLEIRPEHISPALDVLLERAQAAAARAEDPSTPADWANAVEALPGRHRARWAAAWGVVGHLSAVADLPGTAQGTSPENPPRMTEFWSSLGQSLALMKSTRRMNALPVPEFAGTDAARHQLTENELLASARAAPSCPRDKKPALAEIRREQQAQLLQGLFRPCAGCHHNGLRASSWRIRHAWAGAGLPEDAARKPRATPPRKTARPAGSSRCTSRPVSPCCTHADDRALRQTLYEAST
ncbi:hypothetical protein ACTMU2_30495 [Cupriavidus basilensis]